MTGRMMTRPADIRDSADRGGSASVEAVLLVAVLGLLIGFAIAGARLVAVEASTDHAARSAARVASLQRDAVTAAAAGRAAANDSLTEQGLRCADLQVDVDTAGYEVPLGTPGAVTATVRCVVIWSDLGLPAGSDGPVVESAAVSPVDRWRERT